MPAGIEQYEIVRAALVQGVKHVIPLLFRVQLGCKIVAVGTDLLRLKVMGRFQSEFEHNRFG